MRSLKICFLSSYHSVSSAGCLVPEWPAEETICFIFSYEIPSRLCLMFYWLSLGHQPTQVQKCLGLSKSRFVFGDLGEIPPFQCRLLTDHLNMIEVLNKIVLTTKHLPWPPRLITTPITNLFIVYPESFSIERVIL